MGQYHETAGVEFLDGDAFSLSHFCQFKRRKVGEQHHKLFSSPDYTTDQTEVRKCLAASHILSLLTFVISEVTCVVQLQYNSNTTFRSLCN